MSSLTEFFKLVSNETRLRCIVLLAQEDLYVCEICGILNLSQPKVSKHLSKLRELDYITDQRKEKFILYSLNIKNPLIKKLIQDILDNIKQYPVLYQDQMHLTHKAIHTIRCCKTKLPKGE